MNFVFGFCLQGSVIVTVVLSFVSQFELVDGCAFNNGVTDLGSNIRIVRIDGCSSDTIQLAFPTALLGWTLQLFHYDLIRATRTKYVEIKLFLNVTACFGVHL